MNDQTDVGNIDSQAEGRCCYHNIIFSCGIVVGTGFLFLLRHLGIVPTSLPSVAFQVFRQVLYVQDCGAKYQRQPFVVPVFQFTQYRSGHLIATVDFPDGQVQIISVDRAAVTDAIPHAKGLLDLQAIPLGGGSCTSDDLRAIRQGLDEVSYHAIAGPERIPCLYQHVGLIQHHPADVAVPECFLQILAG